MNNLEQRSVQTLGVGHMPRPSRLGGRAPAAAQDPVVLSFLDWPEEVAA